MARSVRALIRWVVLAFVALILFCAFALLAVPGRYYGEWIATRLVEGAARAGVRLVIREPRFRGISFEAAKVEAFVVRALLPLEFERVVLRPRVALAPAGGAAGSFGWYGGTVAFEGLFEPLTEIARGSLHVAELQVSQIPAFSALGVLGGSAALKITDIVVDGKGHSPATARLVLDLRGISKPGVTKLPRELAPVAITIPEIDNLDLHLDGEYRGGRLDFPIVESTSSLGRVRGRAVLELSSRSGAPGIEGEWVINLTERGVRDLGPWIPVVSNGEVAADTTSLRMTLRGSIDRPEVRFSRAG